jgi:phage recombination protein Bet
MFQMLFRDSGGLPIACLDTDENNQPVQADGVRIFSLDQAAEHFHKSKSELEAFWRATWSGVVGDQVIAPPAPDDAPADAPPTAVAATAPTVPVEDLGTRVRLQAMRKMMFPRIADEQFEIFLDMCKLHGMNPWRKECYPKVVPGPDGLVVHLIVSIGKLRARAHASGIYAGCEDAAPEYDEHGRLKKAGVTVYKLIDGVRHPYTAWAYWHEYRPLDEPDDEEREQSLRDQMPHMWLGKCAEALALRRAFPEQCDGLYMSEEFEQADRRRPDPDAHAAPSSRVRTPTMPDPAAPRTFHSFQQQLAELGIEGIRQTSLIREFREEKRMLADTNPSAFWKHILTKVRANPAHYGATVAEAAIA